MKLEKYHGGGNDFFIYDETKYGLIESDDVRRKIAINVCNRKNGLGSDGIMYLQSSEIADAKMRIFNTDGSESEMCGNGVRCFSRFYMDNNSVDSATVETLLNVYKATKNTSLSDLIYAVEVEIDNARIINDKDVLDIVKSINSGYKDVYHTTVSNPHLVILKEDIPIDSELNSYGSKFNKFIPNGINTNYITVIDSNDIYVRTFERGVRITQSCGTGMISSVLVYAITNNLFDEWINIFNDGGRILCRVENKENPLVRFIGNATHVYTAEVKLIDLLSEGIISYKGVFNQLEIENYQKFREDAKEILAKKGF
ncbi:MAG: diaminopimelate epimerase [Alkaliphilus sp.]